ncbi:MAG: hypothetical protein FJW30_18300 [Acidobacteria bacterium]|nr:hypothetical protein [Acidobacteriota bacterium]
MKLWIFVCSLALAAAPPVITELQPRGVQKGRPFVLTVAGSNLSEGVRVLTPLPATFTPTLPEKMGMEGRYASFLVEPTKEWEVGVYPLRVQSSDGLSNIVLLSIGSLPEITEEESSTGGVPNSNDTIEKAQPLPASAITLNGTLRGAERDIYRVQVKAGERRVFEIDARRAGSALDPVIRVMDAGGKQIARSEDSALLQLDPRVDITFPAAGYYYVEVHDARFSGQAQNFYRLKTGAYSYPTEVFPLGGRRGEAVEVSLGAAKVTANLKTAKGPQTTVNLPDSPALPLPFAIGELPEVPETAPSFRFPVTINGRLAKPGEVDKFVFDVNPGDDLLLELQARELGTSKVNAIIGVWDEKGKRLASAGDNFIPLDVNAVQVASRTAGDPFLAYKVPEGLRKLTVSVEDLALRGGPHFGYRLSARKGGHDLQAVITTPFVNLPSGGTALVNLNIDRRGYYGPLEVKALNLPKGVTLSGGHIPTEPMDGVTTRALSRRAMVALTAEPGVSLDTAEIAFAVKGEGFERRATGVGFAIAVAGATSQGVVDRQRALSGSHLGLELPAAVAPAQPAALTLTLEKSEKKLSGYEFLFRWKWTVRNPMLTVPMTVAADVPNFVDLRVINMAVDKEDKNTGTFLVTSTRNTAPAIYDIMINGRLMADNTAHDIYSTALSFQVPVLDTEESNANAPTAAGR